MKENKDMSNKVKVRIEKDTIVVSSIDTSQHKDHKDNREFKERMSFVDGRVRENWKDKGDISMVLSPNQHKILTKLTDTEERYKEIMTAMTVIDFSKVEMNRLDIHTDINIKYGDAEKLLRVFFFSITMDKQKISDRKNIFNEDEMLHEQLEIRTSTFNMKVYDKEAEARKKNENFEYPTRIEVSFQRIEKQDKKFHLKKLIKYYKDGIGNFEKYENKRIESMTKDYDRFIKEYPNTDFTDYVLRRYDKIETRGILEAIYKHSGKKGSFTSWLSKFQKRHGIVLYVEKDLRDMVTKINKSIKEYMNN